ncbi:hypothetical protein U91I_04079 [alpha proteobacterium U9-1i]|nr:hypothetical protein U91I_04079 [alpha proteobacterium U9-1i]
MGARWVKAMAGAVLAAALACAPAFAQVPDPFARDLAQRLSRTDQLVAQQGYSRAAGPFAGGLAQGEARRFSLSLRAGQEYRIVGVCDNRCRDLDMRLVNVNGIVIGEDLLRDAIPVIEVRPPATGQHAVEVQMPGCAADVCYYAFNVYAR